MSARRPSATRSPSEVHVAAWLTLGVSLAALHLLILALSEQFAYGTPLPDYPVVSFVLLEAGAGALYLSLLWLVPRTVPTGALLVWVVSTGLVMRLLMLPSTPILEDDHYRYLWDGGVAVAGIDPYRYSPSQALVASEAGRGELAALGRLAARSAPVAQRVNHPELRTPYPPLAQAAFALAHVIAPWSLTAWRCTLLVLDVVAAWLLYLVLRRVRRSPLWLALYWWCPLVVKELFNSAHMDALLPPLLLGTLLTALAGRRIVACACLALAAAVKIWPVLLMPIVLRWPTARPRGLLGASSLGFLAVIGVVFWVHGNLGAGNSGLGAYARDWQMNDALFGALEASTASVLEALGYVWTDAGRVTRALLALALAGLAISLAWRPASDPQRLAARFAAIIACTFFVLPAPFPWYYTWLVPFLAVVPSPPLLLASVLLSLYYLRFHLDARGQSHLFDTWIVWLEFAPVWGLLLREWLLRRRRDAEVLARAGAA